MMIKFVYNKEFIVARLMCYLTLFILTIIMLFFDPFTYLCNQEGYSCIACGIKTGIYYFIHFKFRKAVECNRFIIYLVIIAGVMVLDTIVSIRKICMMRKILY